MKAPRCGLVMVIAAAALAASMAQAERSDARLRTIAYDPKAVVTVPVKRGMVALVVLGDDEAITDVAAGLGGDCSKQEAVWCIAAQPGGRNIFVKAKSGASAPNNLAVVTDKRTHSLRFEVLADSDSRSPVYRLVIRAPGSTVARPTIASLRSDLASFVEPQSDPAPSAPETLSERLKAAPKVVNSAYAIAEGPGSEDIVPTLVFDDGRFTYFRFPGNREIPAAFHVLGDGSETLVNSRMEDDLLVVDRVSRRLMLRAGSAVVGVWNEAYDLNGLPPTDGTTVPGVQRAVKAGEGKAGEPVISNGVTQ